MTMRDESLRAWCNGYECIAARSESEAREILRAMTLYEDQDLDGDGWYVVEDDAVIKNDDGSPSETMAEILAESNEPRHLYSCEV